MTIRCTKSC